MYQISCEPTKSPLSHQYFSWVGAVINLRLINAMQEIGDEMHERVTLEFNLLKNCTNCSVDYQHFMPESLKLFQTPLN